MTRTTQNSALLPGRPRCCSAHLHSKRPEVVAMRAHHRGRAAKTTQRAPQPCKDALRMLQGACQLRAGTALLKWSMVCEQGASKPALSLARHACAASAQPTLQTSSNTPNGDCCCSCDCRRAHAHAVAPHFAGARDLTDAQVYEKSARCIATRTAQTGPMRYGSSLATVARRRMALRPREFC